MQRLFAINHIIYYIFIYIYIYLVFDGAFPSACLCLGDVRPRKGAAFAQESAWLLAICSSSLKHMFTAGGGPLLDLALTLQKKGWFSAVLLSRTEFQQK